MCTMKGILIYFVIASFKTSCSTQISDLETGIRSTSDNRSQLEEYTDSSKSPEAISIPVTFNPCFSEERDVEHSLEEDRQRFRTRRTKRAYSFLESNQHVGRNQSSELSISDETIKRFSDHFLICSHIGIEPGTFDFFANGSLHIPRLSIVLDRSNFCQDGTSGVVYICDEWIRGNTSDSEDRKKKPNTYDHLSDEFLNCSGHITIEKGNFETFPNRSVYVGMYDRVFNYSNYLIGEDGELYLCHEFFPPDERLEKFPQAFEILTVVGLSVSILFIAAYMFCFALLASLRNLPGYCLFCLCVSLETAYICFLVRGIGFSPQVCQDLVVSIKYFFLASFFWMNVLSFDVWRSLKMATSKLRLSSESMLWKRFALYSVYAWISPFCIVIFGVIFTKYGSSMKYLTIEFHPEQCWVTNKGSLFVYIALPLIILMFLNVIFFSTSFYMITKASMSTTDNMATFWKRFFLFLRLAVIMGVAWIFGIIATATDKLALFYIFVILNTLQGVFIFFSFALNEKTKKELSKKLRMRKTSISQTQMSSNQVQSTTSI